MQYTAASMPSNTIWHFGPSCSMCTAAVSMCEGLPAAAEAPNKMGTTPPVSSEKRSIVCLFVACCHVGAAD